ncbi:hypothetical protein BT96DRAFT_512356 [Gymnopus androsaceus JB14]|uniref:DUF6534 domain-containing protein n=1 Tax=Gymnopus androsaceus JB14 TaxID=1447944 RepID=A0A6A4HUX9_9AGAR|nr:hypothetical protein BT96DRAFT_512356 [Gymnopus androsaceus JB14]
MNFNFHAKETSELGSTTYLHPVLASNIISVIIDSGITVCMSYWILKESRGTYGSGALIVRLITLTVNSGFWTAAVTLASLIAYFVASPLVYGAVSYMMSPLYCNVVLANLNAREYIRDAQGSNIVFGSNIGFETSLGVRTAHSGITPADISLTDQTNHSSITRDLEESKSNTVEV